MFGPSTRAVALVAIEGLGVMSLAGLFLLGRQRRFSPPIAAVCMGIALLAGGTVAWTAHLGGLIHHSEIAATASTPPAAERAMMRGKAHENEDQ